MTKYTRSTTLVTSIIKDILASEGISLDTKVIGLVLAASMEANPYISLIAAIDNLAPVSAKLIELNTLRWKYGSFIRDYIITYAVMNCDKEISSDELQQFISRSSDYKTRRASEQLTPALHIDQIKAHSNWQQKLDVENFATIKKKAAKYLLDKLSIDSHNDKNIIMEAFIYCRSNEKPIVAFYAIVHAIADILVASGLDAKYALIYSYRLATNALEMFTHSDQQQVTMLHSYKG